MSLAARVEESIVYHSIRCCDRFQGYSQHHVASGEGEHQLRLATGAVPPHFFTHFPETLSHWQKTPSLLSNTFSTLRCGILLCPCSLSDGDDWTC
jgi:hypothetical protein